MMPTNIIERCSNQNRDQFFDKNGSGWIVKNKENSSEISKPSLKPPNADYRTSLAEVIMSETMKKKKNPQNEPEHSAHNYELFVDLIYRMLAYDPALRISPSEALKHPFIVEGDLLHSKTSGSSRRR